MKFTTYFKLSPYFRRPLDVAVISVLAGFFIYQVAVSLQKFKQGMLTIAVSVVHVEKLRQAQRL